ncbi:MAG: hypothetical protein F6K55_06150 [Moorea sp. SIO4A3]|nr:hypothetical protein [Moorena sp. SIO4A3]
MNYTTTTPDTDENRATALASLRKTYLLLEFVCESNYHFVITKEEILEAVLGMHPEDMLIRYGMPDDEVIEEYLDVATLEEIQRRVYAKCNVPHDLESCHTARDYAMVLVFNLLTTTGLEYAENVKTFYHRLLAKGRHIPAHGIFFEIESEESKACSTAITDIEQHLLATNQFAK